MKHVFRLTLFGIVFLFNQSFASAGFLDKLNAAAQKLNQTQQGQQGTASQSGGGSLSSGLGATNLHGLTDYNGCMAQTSGVQDKLNAQALERRLNQSPNLSAQEQQKMKEDIEWLNANSTGQKLPAPDPKNSQRYLLELTDEDQVEVNDAYNKFANEVREKCEAQYGGMSQFGDASGARHAPIDTRVALPTLQKTAPVSTKLKRPKAGSNCMETLQGLRWQLMADRMQGKMQSLPNLSPEDRKAWEEDIALVRSTGSNGGKTMPQSPDPKNPTRYLQRLTTDEQTALNQDYATRSREVISNCNGRSSSPESVESNKLAQMHAERARTRNAQVNTGEANKSAQEWLDAHPMQDKVAPRQGGGLGATVADYMERGGVTACYERQKGFRAKQTADRLETKRSSVSSEDRKDLEGWISAWRAAEQAKLDEPTPPNPSDPQGYYRFLTKTDQQELNMAYSTVHNKIREECNSMDHMNR